MSQDCIFCKIVKREIAKDLTYEDENVVVFPDIHPVRPIHLLIIPKEHVSELIKVENPELFQKIFTVVQKMAVDQGLTDKGYRVTMNGGGAQIVNHLHIHLMGPVKQTTSL